MLKHVLVPLVFPSNLSGLALCFCHNSLATLFFFLGLPFFFTDDTSIFTNCLILLYNYSSSVIMITPPSNVIT